MKAASYQTKRGAPCRRVASCAVPKQTGPGAADLLLSVIPEGVLYRANTLEALGEPRDQQPPEDPKQFGTEERLHRLLLTSFKELIKNKQFWNEREAAEKKLRNEAEEICRFYELPFEDGDWNFQLMDRVHVTDIPDKEATAYLVPSAISCSGHLGLWQIPDQLEQDLAALQSEALAAQRAAREHQGLGESHPTIQLYPPGDGSSSSHTLPAVPKLHNNITKGNDRNFFSTVIPPGVQHLLDKLRELETSKPETSDGLQFSLHFQLSSLEKRLAVAQLALQLHVDPAGRLLHSGNLILRPKKSKSWRPENAMQFSSGSWHHGRLPAGVHPGSTAVLVDSLDIDEWHDSQMPRQFTFTEDYNNTCEAVRLTIEGLSLYPPNPLESHVRTTLEELQDVCQGMGWSVNLAPEASDSTSHFWSVHRAHQYGWDYLGTLEKARLVLRWWCQLSKLQQQAVQQQHHSIDVQKLISRIQLPASRVDNRPDIADSVSAVEQLYWQVLPKAVLQQAVDEWKHSLRMRPHVGQLTQRVSTVVAPAAAAAQLGDVAGTPAAAALEQQPDIAATANVVATASPAAASSVVGMPQKGLVAPAAAALAVPEPLEHLHDDPSPGSAQPSRRQKGARGVAVRRAPPVPQTASCTPQFFRMQHALAGPSSSAAYGGLLAASAGVVVPRPLAAAGPSAAAANRHDLTDAAWLGKLGHAPAAHFLHCGKLCVEKLLKEGGVKAVIDMGNACWGGVTAMETGPLGRWLKIDYVQYHPKQPDGTEYYNYKGV